MNHKNNNNSIEFSIPKRIKPRYIVINEDIFKAVDPESLKIYMALRFEVDYQSECSSIRKNIKAICNAVGIKRSTCFVCLKQLEQFGLIRRESNPGYQSTIWVAQDLGHFIEKKDMEIQPEEKKEMDHTPVLSSVHSSVHSPVQQVDYPVQQVDTITNNLFTNSKDLKIYIGDSSNSPKKRQMADYRSDELFMLFYLCYPRKQKPQRAYTAFLKLKADEKFVEMLVEDVKSRKENNWKNRAPEHIPYPSTYLNDREWEGEIRSDEQKLKSTATHYANGMRRLTLEDVWGA